MILLAFILIFLIRLASLRISIRNEKNLIAEGAQQFGTGTSKLLSLAHIAYYFAALGESFARQAVFDAVSAAGLILTGCSLAVLFYVIRALGPIWTVKIYIRPNHQLNRSWLFRHVKHPNYFLNIVPELIGIGLLCHGWTTMTVGLPVYAVILACRIRQEHEAMKHLGK